MNFLAVVTTLISIIIIWGDFNEKEAIYDIHDGVISDWFSGMRT